MDYLSECHIEIEERIFVSGIKEVYSGEKSKLIKTVDRIMAEHKLPKALASKIVTSSPPIDGTSCFCD